MLAFFKYAHEVHGGEAALVLLYHPQRRRFGWHCPEQTVELFRTWKGSWQAADRIEYRNPVNLPDGYLQLGDAHLHPGSPAPSFIDVADDQDGLHIIVGSILSEIRYHVDFVVDGARFRVPPALIFADPHCQPFARPPKRWLRQISLQLPADDDADRRKSEVICN
jgi:hypothetical protein